MSCRDGLQMSAFVNEREEESYENHTEQKEKYREINFISKEQQSMTPGGGLCGHRQRASDASGCGCGDDRYGTGTDGGRSDHRDE